MSVDRAVYERAASAVADKVEELGLGTVSPFDLARAAIDASGLPERLATCVESRDRAEGAYEYANREALLAVAQLRETQAELVEALDWATKAEDRIDLLRDQVGRLTRERDEWEGNACDAGVALERIEVALPYTNGRLGPRSLVAYARARGRA